MSTADWKSTDWKSTLWLGKDRTPRPQLANAIAALREAPEWSSVIAYDEFAGQTVLRAPPPWERQAKPETWTQRAWTGHDDVLAADWMQREEIGVTVAVTQQAVEAVARDAAFHPVRDYLDGVAHDGIKRLDNWMSTYFGAAPSAYHREVGRISMIGAVARIFKPGCKLDTMTILEGPQGALKSTAIKALFDPWFTDELADLGSKDSAMQIRGVWCVEVSELDAMSRGEVSRTKAWMSRTSDRFRPPYGARIITSPRSCAVWGTTNKDDYLKDETGGRRFLPVKIGKIDIGRLRADRDQLWAEAVAAYRSGSCWWITDQKLYSEACQQQSDRYCGDPWDGRIFSYIAGRTSVSVNEVLQDALHLEIGRCGQAEQNRVARCLKAGGWERRQVRSGARREWKYMMPVTPGNDDGDQTGNVTSLRVVTGKKR